MNRKPKILISGGGTGGHVFPAISIAHALKQMAPGAEILFVGAEGRMEMEKVPAAGFRIVGLPVRGFHRKEVWKNVHTLVKLARSLNQADSLLREFAPDVVVGVGGYASGPVLRKAQARGIPTLIQEQNSFAGLTNKWLAARAQKICVAWEGMEKYFPSDRILVTGNPVRQDIIDMEGKKEEGLSVFNFRENSPVVLVLGGSQGARTINRAVLAGYRSLLDAGYQLLWQTGSLYLDTVRKETGKKIPDGMVITDFIARMDLAYAVAGMIVSRAGAGTLSELCLAGKPAILVPSPNVAGDHQTRNAMALVNRKAARMIPDAETEKTLIKSCLGLLADKVAREELAVNIKKMARPEAARQIAKEVLKLVKTEKE